ncbi:hypothetical protein HZS61_005613 [Fusarium oxysporum f. sp. conglutinans]|uniref:Rhodopsin domain-containing protein n=1 Tax=Fusarium oxysporum f. sp. conglutinans TaxID=100902 RepID=A0A8H6GA66_FUSOX|nr:hypothetical protein HZS61_005613 [Fusarium oxysporum f. sp. conglutinans]
MCDNPAFQTDVLNCVTGLSLLYAGSRFGGNPTDNGQFILIPFTVFTLLAIHHGIGLATPLFTKDDLSQALKEVFTLHLLYVCGLAAAKTSILFFYLRVFQDTTFRTLVWITHAFNALSTVTLVTLGLTLGRSVTYLLGSTADSVSNMNKYSNTLKIVLAHCVVNLALDIWMLILPMTQLYNIGLKLDKKINVMAMFGLGLFSQSGPYDTSVTASL